MSRVGCVPVPARWLTPPSARLPAACTTAPLARLLVAFTAAPVALLLAACTAAETSPAAGGDDAQSPFADCAALTAPLAAPAVSAAGPAPGSSSADVPVAAGSSAAAGAATSGPGGGPAASSGGVPSGGLGADLPELSLPCFTGDSPVRLDTLRGPAVINLWGSWCSPCRAELPVMQELADATAGRLRVVGVDTRDTRDAGSSFAADHGISFPTLFDPGTRLLTALGKVNLPVTVFVGADGGRYVYTGKLLDKPTLGGLVRTHTGVTVTG